MNTEKLLLRVFPDDSRQQFVAMNKHASIGNECWADDTGNSFVSAQLVVCLRKVEQLT